MLAIFAEHLSGSYAIFREQYAVLTTPSVKNWGVFSEQFSGGFAVFRDQTWISEPEIPTPGPTKLSIRMLSSGKVRLINGRIQLYKSNYV